MPAYFTPIYIIIAHIRKTKRLLRQFSESIILKQNLNQLEHLYYLRTGRHFEYE